MEICMMDLRSVNIHLSIEMKSSKIKGSRNLEGSLEEDKPGVCEKMRQTE